MADLRYSAMKAARRCMSVLLLAMLAGLCPFHAAAQSAASSTAVAACDRHCEQVKMDALFEQARQETIAHRPKPSASSECMVFDGHDHIDPLIDVCAKLKYVRSLPAGTPTRFSCPFDTHSLIGLKLDRIHSLWGDPDFVDDGKSQLGTHPGPRWSYTIGSPVPLALGGGYPELSLYYDQDGNINDVTCFYSR